MELEISKFLRMARASSAGHVHGTALLVLTRADVVRIVRSCIQILVLAHRNGLGMLPLADSRRACPLCNLILVMVLLLWRRVNRFIPPVS